jgi:two-component system alkaline phosphatase synthesis response regulator PhoP
MNEKIKILVVEDEVSVASLMTFLLTRAGYDVQVAFRGRQALELAQREKFGLITLDVDMPGLNGFEICRELRQQDVSSQTPIVFVSGRADEASRQKAFALGASDFIEKPFPADDFICRIDSFARTEFCPSETAVAS